MNQQIVHSRDNSPVWLAIQPTPVVGLHCSGADGRQWCGLFDRFSDGTTTLAPDLIGTASRGHRTGSGPFMLADEAAPIIEMMETLPAPAHIVGHSYGGALALHIARARPDLVHSLCLYEPTLFALLRKGEAADELLYSEIQSLTQAIQNGIEEGCSNFSAQIFTDFWGGLGAWQALSRDRRSAMVDWIAKAPSDFEALLSEPDPKYILSGAVPTTIIVGKHTHAHTLRIAEMLLVQADGVKLKFLDGAGHLGPFTFREKFELEVLSHLKSLVIN